MHRQRRLRVLFNLRRAVAALERGLDASATEFTDMALKVLNHDEDDALPYKDHVAACDAFLEKSGFPTLAVALVYIENYRKKADG